MEAATPALPLVRRAPESLEEEEEEAEAEEPEELEEPDEAEEPEAVVEAEESPEEEPPALFPSTIDVVSKVFPGT